MAENTRVFRVSRTSKASIKMEEDSVSIIGDNKNFITCDSRGISIRGPISFVSDSLNRRTAGLFTGINDFFEMIPQTLITPIPSKIPFPPAFAINNIQRDVAFFMALLM